MYYAQLDGKGKVHTICQLAGEVNALNLIGIDAIDSNYLGSYYDRQAGTFQHIEITADKTAITANGLDTATVTAKVPAVLAEITFYHAVNGEAIVTVPVDSVTHTATLQVTATTPGVIKIRAGEQTVGRLSEVEVTAQ